ncbi:MAG: hypothetical protein HQM10_22595 [Candidatus Riflebacteria bacterium]|nr:hypothetical protein [Candidatus Riflebacteria bacterium]
MSMKNGCCWKKGLAIPLVLLAVIIAAGFIIVISSLNQGLRTQVAHSNKNQASFLLAYSVFSRVLAKIHADTWVNRPFAAAAYRENAVSFQGGKYDLYVVNTPGKNFQADIYILTTLAESSQLFFWRIRYNDDLLDISNKILVDFYKETPANAFPTNGSSYLADEIDQLMTKRAANQKNADDFASKVSKVNNPASVLNIIGGKPPETFTANYPKDVDDPSTLLGAREFPPVPNVDPLAVTEIPDNGGPGGNSGDFSGNGFPALPSNSGPESSVTFVKDFTTMSEKANLSALAAKEAIERMNLSNAQGDEAGVNAAMAAAGDAFWETVKNLEDLRASFANNKSSEPSSAAIKSAQDMLVQTSANSAQDLGDGADGWTAYVDSVARDIIQRMKNGEQNITYMNDKVTFCENGLTTTKTVIENIQLIQDKIADLSSTSMKEVINKVILKTSGNLQSARVTVSEAKALVTGSQGQ